MKNCIVFICNKEYYPKFLYTCNLLLKNGKPERNLIDICLIIGDDLYPAHIHEIQESSFIKNNKIRIKYFPNINPSKNFMELCKRTKLFQFHKFYLFHEELKEWKYILYIDCGMTIFKEIEPFFQMEIKDSIIAHSDAYPTFQWKLRNQFIENNKNKIYKIKEYMEYFNILNNEYDLNVDYFQSTMLLYDTSIIHTNLFNNLCELMEIYPTTTTNEQSLLSLYFIHIEPRWKSLPIQITTPKYSTHTYDFFSRNPNYSYIMIKYRR